MLSLFSHDPLFATWTVLPGSSVHGIPRQEYWSGLLCPPPEDLPDPGIKPMSSEAKREKLINWMS